MCGIVGVISSGKTVGKLSSSINDFIRQAMVVGSLRGRDSTGMFQVTDKGEVNSFKLPYEGWIFAMNKEPMKMATNTDDALATIIHHRAGTFGAVTAGNAHPFAHHVGDRSVIGVHNGSLNSLAYQYDGINFSVDSDLLYYKIAKMGGKEAIEDSKGAMTLVWYEKDGKIRIYSNGQRPLYWNFVSKENVMMLASEDAMLHWLCDRNGIPLEKNMWTPHKDTLYIIDPADVRKYSAEMIDESKTTSTFGVRQDWRTDNNSQRPLMLPNSTSTTKSGDGEDTVARFNDEELEPDRFQSTFQGEPLYKGYEHLAAFDLQKEKSVIFVPLLPTTQPNRKWQQLVGRAYWRGADQKDHSCLCIMAHVDDNTREIIYRATELRGEIRARPMNTCLIKSTKAGTQPVRALVLMRPYDTRIPDDEGTIMRQSDDDAPFVPDANSLLVVPGPKGHMSIAVFRQATKDGCVMCSGEIPVQEAIEGEASYEPNSNGGVDWMCADCTQKANLELAFPGYVCQE